MTDYFKPSVTVDALVFSDYEKQICILLIQRKNNPFAESWALPGGFIEPDETLLESAQRELLEETGLKVDALIFTGIYGDPGRDPRGRTISAAYRTPLLQGKPPVQAQDDAKDARWFPISQLPELAFDHQQIINDALRDLYASIVDQYPAQNQPESQTAKKELDESLKQVRAHLKAVAKLDDPV